MTRILLLLLLALAISNVAWGDASPYCGWELHFSAEPTRQETRGCERRIKWLSRLCEKPRNAGLAICVTGATTASCRTYIPSKADCDANKYVCSGMPAAGDLPENWRCYFGGGDVNTTIPARTDALPIPPPPCLATFPQARPTRSELRRCFKKLAWFQELCAEPRNSGLAPCVTQIWTAGCLPYSASDADCIAGRYQCATRALDNSRCDFGGGF